MLEDICKFCFLQRILGKYPPHPALFLFLTYKISRFCLVWQTTANDSVHKWTVWMNQIELLNIAALFAYQFGRLHQKSDSFVI